MIILFDVFFEANYRPFIQGDLNYLPKRFEMKANSEGENN